MTDIDLSFTLPSSQTDRDKIKKVLEECSGQLQMIDDKKLFIKEAIEALSEEYSIPKKTLNAVATSLFKNNYAELSHNSGMFELVYEGTIGADAS